MSTLRFFEKLDGDAGDVLCLRVENRTVCVPLSGDGEPGALEHSGFADDGKARDFVMLVCSRLVGALLPEEQRQRLMARAQEAGLHEEVPKIG